MSGVPGTRPTIRATPFALPALLAEIARITDQGTALALAREFGGRDIYVPRKPRADQKLTLAVGLAAATAISARFGGCTHKIPSAKAFLNWREVHRLRDEGKSTAEISAEVGLGQRYIQRLLEGHEAPPRHPSADAAPIAGDAPATIERNCA